MNRESGIMNELPGVVMTLTVNRGTSWVFRRAGSPLLVVLLALSATATTGGQTPGGIRDWDDGIKYARGQNVVPVFEGLGTHPSKTGTTFCPRAYLIPSSQSLMPPAV